MKKPVICQNQPLRKYFLHVDLFIKKKKITSLKKKFMLKKHPRDTIYALHDGILETKAASAASHTTL